MNRFTQLMIVFGLTFPFASLADGVQSDTVPTSQLAAVFDVMIQNGSGQVQASVTLTQIQVVNGVEQDTVLIQSADDVATFTGGGSTIVFDPNNHAANLLPAVIDSTYTVTFKRATGETFNASVALPASAVIATPTSSQVLPKQIL